MDNKAPIRICNNCGVELEVDLINCPLCNKSILDSHNNDNYSDHGMPNYSAYSSKKIDQKQKKIIWEIISICLLSGSTATFIIDIIINNRITWSEYPVAISLTIFTYISLLTFWNQKLVIQITGSLILSSFLIVIIDMLASGINWSLNLGIPILLSSNIAILLMIIAIRMSKQKGINLIAYGFLSAALLCICIDGILSFYNFDMIKFKWSLIVAGSIIPVVFVLIFVHYRLKKGRGLKKTFHI